MLSIPGPHILTIKSSSRRGGSFFTMLIFVMLLVSTALMYYYFQRTRFLERQIAALQRGEQPENSSLSEFVSWVKGAEETGNVPVSPAPISTPRPLKATPVITQDIPSDTLPAPTPGDANATLGSEVTLPPVDQSSTQGQILQVPDSYSSQDTFPEEAATTRHADDAESEATPPPADSNRPIDSIYDTPEAPPVRVRSPQRR